VDEVPALAGRALIAVSDGAIAEVAGELADAGFRDGAALHVCGALGPEVLRPLAGMGVSCGVLHPIQTIPSAERGVTALRGICWGVTADREAAEWAGRIAGLLDGRVLRIAPEKRAAYHAAGVTACNYFVALEDAALAIMDAAGVGREEALDALAPMVESTLRNTFEMGPTEALTGPVLRGDAETVRRHLEAIDELPDTVRGLYRAAALHTVEIARRRGLDEESAGRLEKLLRDNGIRNG
jgi:predicted short-subunit dehydrogenase-like oxidoreductase (DUF2520 family)